jgi:hypothetical protein
MDKYAIARRFNSGPVPRLNEEWTARVLGMQRNPHPGPDLISEDKIVEVKFTLARNSKNYFKWNVLEHQLNYSSQAPNAFWAFGFYDLQIPVQKVKTKDPEELESLIPRREVYIVQWDWIHQFQSKKYRGKTQNSIWDYQLKTALFNKFPTTIQTREVEKGLVHLTEGVYEEIFHCENP